MKLSPFLTEIKSYFRKKKKIILIGKITQLSVL